MPFKIDQLDETPPRWVRLGLEDMEAKVRLVGPLEAQKFTSRMLSQGVIRQKGEPRYILTKTPGIGLLVLSKVSPWILWLCWGLARFTPNIKHKM